MSTNDNPSWPYIEALNWHIDEDIDTPIEDTPVDRRISSLPEVSAMGISVGGEAVPMPVRANHALSGTFAAQKAQAAELARACMTLDELKVAINAFDVLEIKRTAMQLVFGDGQAGARVMVIGDAPEADDDRNGMPFTGYPGQMLDRMFDCIGLNRRAGDVKDAIYTCNLLNWRPPGGRTPTDVEYALSLPFIERHIALARPEFVVLMGTDTGKVMLSSDLSLSRMRGKLRDYTPLTPDIQAGLEPCNPKVMVTYHPSYLLKTPLQKKAAWQDLLMLQSALM